MQKLPNSKANNCYAHLVQCLRDSVCLYHQTQMVHWNLMGENFYSIHKLTQEIYEEMADAIDVIAEHLRSLGIAAPTTIADLIYSDLPEVPLKDVYNEQAIITGLHNNHRELVAKFDKLISMANQIDDQLTVDLGCERGRAHKKFQWLLKASLGN